MARSFVPLTFEVRHPAARAGAASAAAAMPCMNVGETVQELRIEVELPGVPEEDVQVELAGDVLTIRGEKRIEREDVQHHIAERSFGTFARSLRLPFPAEPDRARATFHNGVLTITLPKPAAQERVHRIPVQAARGAAAGGSNGQAAAVAGHPTPETTHEGSAVVTAAAADERDKGRHS